MSEKSIAKNNLKLYEQMMRDQMAKLQAPDPFLSKLMGLNEEIMDWHTGAGGVPKDIYKHPTIASKLPVFQMAKRNMDKGRIGRGVAGSTNMGKSQYAKELGMEDDFDRSIAASGMLEMGLQDEFDKSQKNSFDLWNADQSRRSGAFDIMSNLWKMDEAKANKPSGWGNFFKGLAGGALQAGMAFI